MQKRFVRPRSRGLLMLWFFSALVLFIALAPFVWIMIVSLTPEVSQFTQGIQYFPDDPTLENYFNIFTVINFGQGFRNSLFIAVIVTLLSIVISISAAYAFARYQFWGRTVLILFLLVVYMIPGIVLLMPMMVIFRTLGLMNTYAALILAEATHSVPFAIWLLMNYFASLPRDLEDAGLVDGCTRLGALVRIVLPLAVPGILAAALFVFIGSWNNFLFAFMLTSGERVRTLPVLLRIFVAGDSGVYWGTVMAGAVLTTLPVAFLFLFFQRYLISGLAAGAVKG
jgi:ABC-type glycerol-3-phosphate transport system permease component